MTGLERRLYQELVRVKRATKALNREARMAAKLRRAQTELLYAQRGWGEVDAQPDVGCGPVSVVPPTQRRWGVAS